MKKLLTTFAIFIICFITYGQVGSITNILVEQRTDGSGIVDIHYDLAGVDGGIYNVSLEASFDGGDTYDQLSSEFLSGDLEGVGSASDLHVEWDGLASHPDIYTEEAMLKIIATLDDNGNGGTVTDIDGNVYTTLVFGDLEWLGENLRVTKYNNGDAIPTNLSNSEWQNTSSGAYAVYDHEEVDGIDSEAEMIDIYGNLYNWHAVNDSRGLCPEGWEVPSDIQWTRFTNFLIDNNEDITDQNVGSVLKSCRQVNSPLDGDCETNEHPRYNAHDDHYGTDDYGFSALPAGFRSPFVSFGQIGSFSTYWSSTEAGATFSYRRNIIHYNSTVTRQSGLKTFGLSVRCVREVE